MSPALDALRLDGRAAIVTGASRGLGRARALAGAGAAVALVVPADVTVYSQVETLVERAAETLGPLSVYLASPASDYMTGQTMFLDGGHSAA